MSIQRLLVVALALALATAGFAYPNFNATTGIVGVPNALTVAGGAFIGAADISFQDDTQVILRAIYGLGPNFEVGGLIGLGDNNSFGVTGKYRFQFLGPSLDTAVGLSFADADEAGSGFQLFLVGSRMILGEPDEDMSILGSLGVTFTDFEELSGILPFVGAQLMLPGNLEVCGEFVLEAGDFTESIFSLLLRKQFTETWAAQVGFTNATGFLGTGDSDLFIGASYAFGAGEL